MMLSLKPEAYALESEARLITAGAKIRCRQCQARSKRTQQQCRAPAERNKLVCRFHGARSTGPKTKEGKLRVARGKVRHGNETRQARSERSEKSALLAHLEDIMHVTGMTTAPRTRGRKPSGYKPITSLQDAFDFAARHVFHSNTPGDRSDNKK
jgi:hypothetical protein